MIKIRKNERLNNFFGLILAFAGLFLMVYANHNNYESWWDYFRTLVGFGLVFTGYNKIEKSTN